MKSGLRFQLLVSIVVVATSMLAGYAVSETSPQTLASPESFASIADTEARSAAIFTELGKVLTHPRCTNCHPAVDRPRQGDPHGRRSREERRTDRAAEGVHRPLRVPVRLLHRRLPERGAGSARAPGQDAGCARRTGEDHRRGARRTSLPLHRLHQISRGGARRDSRRRAPLSRIEQVTGSGAQAK